MDNNQQIKEEQSAASNQIPVNDYGGDFEMKEEDSILEAIMGK